MSWRLFRSIYGGEPVHLSTFPCAVRQRLAINRLKSPSAVQTIVARQGSHSQALPPHLSQSPPSSRFTTPPSSFPQSLYRMSLSTLSLTCECHEPLYHHSARRHWRVCSTGRVDQRCSCLHQLWRMYAKKAKKSTQKLSEDDQDILNLERVESSMEAAVNALKYEYTNTIIARITPASLDKVTVEIEGEPHQLKQVAQIGMPKPQTIVINMSSYPQAVDSVVAALRESDLKLSPITEKNTIKVPIPKMTKELRESLVKVAKGAAEKCKVGVRKARQKAMADLKKKTDVSKDSVRRLEKHVQELTDKHTGKIEELLKAKSAELLKGS